MRKSVSRNLYLLALLFTIVAAVLVLLGLQGSTINTVQTGPYSFSGSLTSIGNPPVFFAGTAVAAIGAILSLIAWFGALIRTAQLGRWGWFVCLIIFSGITMLVYIFAGPTTRAGQPAYAVQYPGQPYPPQQYPRQ